MVNFIKTIGEFIYDIVYDVIDEVKDLVCWKFSHLGWFGRLMWLSSYILYITSLLISYFYSKIFLIYFILLAFVSLILFLTIGGRSGYSDGISETSTFTSFGYIFIRLLLITFLVPVGIVVIRIL